MSEFKKWFVTSKYNDEYYQVAIEAWQAATAESDKRVRELTATIAELQATNHELSTSIKVLREALEFYNDAEFPYSIANDALTLTPAQSLQEHDNEVIERVVTLLKDWTWGDGIIDMRADDLIEDVRKLKGK